MYNFLLTRLFFCLFQRPNWGPRPSGLTVEVKPRPPDWATDITSWGQRSSRATCTCGDWLTTPSTGSGAGRRWRWVTFANSAAERKITHSTFLNYKYNAGTSVYTQSMSHFFISIDRNSYLIALLIEMIDAMTERNTISSLFASCYLTCPLKPAVEGKLEGGGASRWSGVW